MENLLIFYLTSNDRPFVFEKFVGELMKSKYLTNLKLLVVNSSNDFEYYRKTLEGTNINYELSTIPCPQSNYLPKVRFAISYAIQNNFKYILKYDSDVLIPTYTLNFMLENLNVLDDETNLTLGPSMTTGIPTIETFINSFLTEDEARQVRQEFKKCVFQLQPSIMDYRPMNKYSIESDVWDYNQYYNGLNSYMDSLQDFGNGRTIDGYSKFYRGIHPIRHGFGNELLNEFIIRKREHFFSEKQCTIVEDNLCKQLVAMCFLIKTSTYDRILNKENLTIDGCDEVPINRFGWQNNVKHLIIDNGYAIHITYNWRWYLNQVDGGSNIEKPKLSMLDYESDFIKKLYE
jgi:hypothetical protein